MKLYYKIGDITFKIDNCFHEDVKKYLDPYEIPPVENPEMEFIVHTDCQDMKAPDGTLVAEVNCRNWYKMPDGGCAFLDHYDNQILLNLVVCSADFSKVEAWFCPFEMFDYPTDFRPFNMIHEVFKHALLQKNGTIIHSSSLAYEGKGILFSADSGTGKSTHTGLWLKHLPGTQIVNDDMPIVRFKDDVPYLYGSPWSGKHFINTNMSVPLSSLVFLERGEKNELFPFDKNEAVWRLLGAIRKPILPDLAEKNLDIIGQIVENIPLYRLTCTISEEAVKVAMQAL